MWTRSDPAITSASAYPRQGDRPLARYPADRMRTFCKSFVWLTIGLLWAVAGWAQPEPTLEKIMSDPEWIGRPPEQPYWAADGRTIFYYRKREGAEQRDLWRWDLEADSPQPVPRESLSRVDGPEGDWSPDRRRYAFSRNGDLFVREGERLRQLTRTAENEESPRFLKDGRSFWYRVGGRVLVHDLESAAVWQPAELRFEEEQPTPAEGFLGEQQPRLFATLRKKAERERRARQDERTARTLDPGRVPAPFFLGKDSELVQSWLSPSGKRLLVALKTRADQPRPRQDSMPAYVTESGYVEVEKVRPKVGVGKGEPHRLLFLDLEAHTSRELELERLPGRSADPLAELRKEPLEGTRPLAVGQVVWHSREDRAAIQLVSLDHKDRWTLLLDGAAGGFQVLEHLSDPAWVADDHNQLGWAGNRLYYVSERGGYAHLHLDRQELTSGGFEVTAVQPSPDGRFLYFRANREHPGVYDVYRVGVDGGPVTPVTRLGGDNDYTLSPDGARLALLHSTAVRPPELYLQEARPDAVARQLTSTISHEFLSIAWTAPEIVPVPSSHHARPIYARLYPARGAGPRPAVVFIHGAGYLQNAHQGWSYYFREFMFHTLLNRRGFVVLDLDYRASAGYGRDWRTAIYRQMGQPELEDLEDGVRWLVEQQLADPRRIGVYGGSYGGFLTFMALFRKPELFACGAALRPVTDWAHYNEEYTSPILNTPEIDPEAYRRSSPIEYAEGLRAPLLMCHGMLDDNVLVMDTVRLAQRLIELEKENWEMALYPMEAHAFKHPTSWLDEYRRVLKLFETHLR